MLVSAISTTSSPISSTVDMFDPSFLSFFDTVGLDGYFHEAFTQQQDHQQQQQEQPISVSSLIDNNSDCDWNIMYCDGNVMQSDSVTRIILKSRKYHSKLPKDEHVDEHLYSSVSYSMKHEAEGSFVENMPKHQVLLARVEIVDPQTGLPILKNDRPILDGATDCTIARTSSGFMADMKIKFNSCSYHFNKSSFAFRVSYSFDSLDKPFLIKQSRPFLVFARKPNSVNTTEKKQLKKKKKRRNSDDDDLHNSKRRKYAAPLEAFTEQMDCLFNSLKELTDSDKSLALEMLANKMNN